MKKVIASLLLLGMSWNVTAKANDTVTKPQSSVTAASPLPSSEGTLCQSFVVGARKTAGLVFVDTAQECGTVLSTQEIAIMGTNGAKVVLPKVQRKDGTVCQYYLSTVSTKADDFYVQTSTICDEPVSLKSGLGPDEIYPRKLRSMEFVRVGDLGIHVVSV